MVTKAKRTANDKWDKENMALLGCKLRKDEAEAFKAYANRNGTTVNALLSAYIRGCINGTDTPK